MAMKEVCIIAPTSLPNDVEVHLPSSKSVANRLLIIQALSGEKVEIDGLSDADDTQLLRSLLYSQSAELNSKNAGTVFRFLTAYLSLQKGQYSLSGSERMMKRPVGPLVDALRSLGARIEYQGEEGFPPLRIRGADLSFANIEMTGDVSSQFVSALMLIGPNVSGGLRINLPVEQVSRSYIHMTYRIMKAAGADIEFKNNTIIIGEGQYRGGQYEVEKDWSSAHFWMELSSMYFDSPLKLIGLKKSGLQGDEQAMKYFEKLGITAISRPDGITIKKHQNPKNQDFEYDLSSTPDAFPALACAVAALGRKTVFAGLGHLQYKESNRLEAVVNELNKVGVVFDQREDALIMVKGLLRGGNPVFNTYDDHRLAMAFAMLSPNFESVTVVNPDVVVKSYPSFWVELKKAGFTLNFKS